MIIAFIICATLATIALIVAVGINAGIRQDLAHKLAVEAGKQSTEQSKSLDAVRLKELEREGLTDQWRLESVKLEQKKLEAERWRR